jgi:hypothetical protein
VNRRILSHIFETDDYLNYMCHVKEDFGSSFGPPLTITSVCRSSEAAWAELDRMLGLWAKQVKRGTLMTEDEQLEVFWWTEGESQEAFKQGYGAMTPEKIIHECIRLFQNGSLRTGGDEGYPMDVPRHVGLVSGLMGQVLRSRCEWVERKSFHFREEGRIGLASIPSAVCLILLRCVGLGWRTSSQ